MSATLESPYVQYNDDKKHLVADKWWSNCQEPTNHFTTIQIAWIVFHSVLSTVACGGINYGFSKSNYQDTAAPTYWSLPSGIFASMCMLIIFGAIFSWMILSSILTADIVWGRLPPLNPKVLGKWWPEKGSYWHWYMNTSVLVVKPKPIRSVNDEEDKEVSCCRRLFVSFQRSLPWLAFLLIGYLSIYSGLVYWRYGPTGYGNYPLPSLIIGVCAGGMSILTVPFWTIMALAHVGERMIEDRF